MNELAAREDLVPGSIGPGRLVLVVGPSGVGKDSVLAGAKVLCAAESLIVFPQRMVTRRVTSAEEHVSVDHTTFEAALKSGRLALAWEAYGLHYGLPISIDADIRLGRTVVCNVSRGIVAEARKRYARVICAMITAPADVLAARLATRSREDAGALRDRIARNNLYVNFSPDIGIENIGASEEAIDALVRLLRSTVYA